MRLSVRGSESEQLSEGKRFDKLVSQNTSEEVRCITACYLHKRFSFSYVSKKFFLFYKDQLYFACFLLIVTS